MNSSDEVENVISISMESLFIISHMYLDAEYNEK